MVEFLKGDMMEVYICKLPQEGSWNARMPRDTGRRQLLW